MHKAIRLSKGQFPEDISMSIKNGSVLDEPWHSSRVIQLQKHCKEIAVLGERYDNAHWLEEDVKKIQQLESEWTYQDFELTVLNALPALLSNSRTSLK